MAIIILNAGLLIGLARHTRPSYFFLGSGMIFLDPVGHGMGIIYGILSYLRGKRY